VPQSDQDFQLAQCLCTTDTCGAGMANAAGSVAAAERPITAVALPATVAAGQNVSLNASSSAAACGRTLSSFAWAYVSPSGNPPAIVGVTTSSATVIAPTTGSLTVRVTVTDDLGRTDFADVTVNPNSVSSLAPASAGTTACATPVTSGPTPVTPPPSTPTPTPPRSSGGGGGGGGSLGLITLGLLGALCLAGERRRRHAHISRCNC
jgi:serine protease